MLVLLDDDAGPYPCHQLVFADDSVPRRGQYAEVERPATKAHRGAIAPQLAPREIKPEPAVTPSTIGFDPIQNN